MKYLIILIVAGAFSLTACKDKGGDHKHAKGDGQEHEQKHEDHDEDNHEGHVHGPNGGELKDIGSVGKLEYILDESAGTMALYILDKDGKNPVKISKAPQVIAKINGKRVAVDFKSDSIPSSKFTLKHDVLEAHVDLSILLSIDCNDVPFNVPIPHVHH